MSSGVTGSSGISGSLALLTSLLATEFLAILVESIATARSTVEARTAVVKSGSGCSVETVLVFFKTIVAKAATTVITETAATTVVTETAAKVTAAAETIIVEASTEIAGLLAHVRLHLGRGHRLTSCLCSTSGVGSLSSLCSVGRQTAATSAIITGFVIRLVNTG